MVRSMKNQGFSKWKIYRLSYLIIFVLFLIYLPHLLGRFNVSIDKVILNRYFIAFTLGYIIFGIISDILSNAFASHVWNKTTNSYLVARGYDVPFWLNSEKRKPFNWAPRYISIIERILYTSAIVFGQLSLIGVWIVFKAIGQWTDFSSKKNSIEDEGTTRIRANNYLIGSGFSLILGILGGIIFRLILDNNFLSSLIEMSYEFDNM